MAIENLPLGKAINLGLRQAMLNDPNADSPANVDAAVRDVKGNLSDKAALRKAIAAAKFDSVRGGFKFNSNGFPIQDYYLRVITKDAQGRITNRTLGTVFKNHADAYADQCKMPAI